MVAFGWVVRSSLIHKIRANIAYVVAVVHRR